MPPVIDYYYTPISGFAYLGEPRLRDIARRAGVAIVYKPVDIGRLFSAVGTVPPVKQSPARLAYREADMSRWAERLNMPLNPKPAFWPTDAWTASYAVIAADLLGDDPAPLSFALLEAVWARDLDIADPAVICDCATRAGLDAGRLVEYAGDPQVAARFTGYTDEAIAGGVIGSPSYRFGESLFWGQDRLDFVENALS